MSSADSLLKITTEAIDKAIGSGVATMGAGNRLARAVLDAHQAAGYTTTKADDKLRERIAQEIQRASHWALADGDLVPAIHSEATGCTSCAAAADAVLAVLRDGEDA